MPKRITVIFAVLLAFLMGTETLAETFVDTEILMLVNSSHRISKNYKPAMVRYEDTYFYMNVEAAASLSRMLDDMEKELGRAPDIISTYRSYERQEEIYNNDIKSDSDIADAIEGTSRYVAIPGGSEHQTALAVDLSNDGTLEENFINTEAGIWIAENSYKYGFVVRYKRDKEQYTGIGYEPWHIRYLGQPYSDILYENDWCLEEFIAYMKRNIYMVWEDGQNIWTLYFTKNPEGDFDSNTTVSNTNSGGYIVTSRKKSETRIQIYRNGLNAVDEGRRGLARKLEKTLV
ncbi:putative carboxypeptidase YodJ [Clostridiales bacterium]|nr:putative carboxypeptidase YodJ [Clostridiales bacterium]